MLRLISQCRSQLRRICFDDELHVIVFPVVLFFYQIGYCEIDSAAFVLFIAVVENGNFFRYLKFRYIFVFRFSNDFSRTFFDDRYFIIIIGQHFIRSGIVFIGVDYSDALIIGFSPGFLSAKPDFVQFDAKQCGNVNNKYDQQQYDESEISDGAADPVADLPAKQAAPDHSIGSCENG
ncbi:hypothetical protein DSECCO2_392990 [anaerobic digester metagenome]